MAASAITEALNEAQARAERLESELAAAQAQLKAVSLQLHTAQHLARVGSWSLDIASGAVEWSDELFRIFRLDPAAGAPTFDVHATLFVPADFLLLQAAIEKSTTTGEGYELTLAIVRSDGTMGTAVARAETIADNTGRVIKLVGTFQDITERHRQTELQLREYGERFGLAASVARIGSWEWNAQTGEHRWDDAVYQMYGVSKEQIDRPLREVWQSAVHPDDRERAEIHGRDALAGVSPFNIVYRVRTPAGVRYIHAIAVVHRDEQGLPTRVVGMNKDVTEQRQAQLALASSEALRRAVIDHAGPVFIATDTAGVITLFNGAAEQLLGYRADDVVGKHTPDLFHDHSEVLAYGAELNAAGFAVTTPLEIFTARCADGADVREWTYIARDGRRIPVLLTVTTLRDDTGVIGQLGVAVDLTTRKQQQREQEELNALLRERNAQKEVLLQEVHHRVKNNLQVIASLMNMQLRKLDDVTAKRALIECRTRVESIALIHEQLYQSKDYARVPFSEYCVKLANNVFYTSGTAPERVALQLDIEPVALPVDEAIPLGLILNELITNALKHAFPADARGTVRIHLHSTADNICLSVQDNGVGAAPLAGSPSSLGTQLVQTLTRQLQGTIDTVIDNGTRFTVTFPRGAADHD